PELALDTILSLSEEKSREVLFVGDGALKYRDIIFGKMNALACFPSKVLQFPSAAYLAELGLSRLLSGKVTAPELAEPVYLRASAAELKRAEALVKDKGS
ncbi:hypothetical protein JYT87_03715, partial [Nitrospira defluvii]|nr:hypothetical protein [Nitrospira defluvii]